MSEVFASYENDYEKNLQQLCTLIRQAQVAKSDEQLSEITQLLSDLQNCIQQMDIESTSVAVNDRSILKGKVRGHKTELESMRKKVLALEEEISSQRAKDNLFGEQDNQQIKFLKTEEKLIQQTLQLQDAKRVCFEVEQVANNIQVNMSNQTELLKNNIDKTQGIDSELGESNSRLTRIRQKMREHKVVFAIVLAMFLISGTIIIVQKFLV